MTQTSDRGDLFRLAPTPRRAVREGDAEARSGTVGITDAVAGTQLPAVRDCLTLREYVEPEVASAVSLCGDNLDLPSYVWFSELHFEQVHRWLMGLLAADQANLPIQFFSDAIVDKYHYDRALRASTANRRHKPILYKDVPKELETPRGYELVRKDFKWTHDVPDRVVSTVSHLVCTTPPDSFWIADYVQRATASHYDPVIYASYGPWHVEVARWN